MPPSSPAGPGRREVEAYATGLLLRYYHASREAAGQDPGVWEGHRAVLRRQWALSEPVRTLTEHLVRHPHELTSVLDETRREDDARVRGRIDARETVVARRRSGVATRVVFYEPARSLATGPNAVLFFVLAEADALTRRLLRAAPSTGGGDHGYVTRAEGVADVIEQARRFGPLRLAMAEAGRRRPSGVAVRQAARSRRALYRLAASAYRLLQRLEAGAHDAVEAVLRETLVAPVDTWRAFELALVLGMANALGEATGEAVRFHQIPPPSGRGIVDVGRYAFHWQRKTGYYEAPSPTEAETLRDAALAAYGLSVGGPIPDVVVVDTLGRRVVALGEAKYYGSWKDGIRDGVDQLARYSLGYTGDAAALLARSVVGLRSAPDGSLPPTPPAVAPIVTDFYGLQRGRLEDWASRVVAHVEAG